VIGHAAIMTQGPSIDAADLPSYLIQPASPTQAEIQEENTTLPSLISREKELLVGALKKSNSNQSEAARILRISRDKLRYKMKKHGLV
jgi:DNA-binding NtrC family response regulator